MNNIRPKHSYTTDEICTKITEILIAFGVPHKKISLDANFSKDIGLGTLDFAALLVEVEYFFQIYIPSRDINKLSNLDTTTQYIQDTLKK